MMMALGLFVFKLSTAAYQEFQRSTSWKHAGNNRFGTTPSYQYTGKGEDTITLTGDIYPELTGFNNSLDRLREMADTGKAYILIEGTGKIYGACTIGQIQETKTVFFKNGGARKISFTVNLTIIRDYEPSILGGLVGMGVNLANRFI